MSDEDKIYPCAKCPTLRSRSEGGAIFTVCDSCWDGERPLRDGESAVRIAALESVFRAVVEWRHMCWHDGEHRDGPKLYALRDAIDAATKGRRR
jgi:hypothetical protein